MKRMYSTTQNGRDIVLSTALPSNDLRRYCQQLSEYIRHEESKNLLLVTTRRRKQVGKAAICLGKKYFQPIDDSK